ncbi:MAG: hypothetical protein ABI120_02240, partial [Gemmatimonadaceae bacterium]
MNNNVMSRIQRFTFWSALFAVAACENGPRDCNGDHILGITQNPTITVTTTAATTKVLRGGTLQVAILATFAGGPTGATLSIGGTLPPGVTATFSPTTVTESMTSIMTLSADSVASIGIFIYDVVATESGTANNVVTRTQLTAEVEIPFQLQMSGGQIATVGTSTSFTVKAARGTGFTAPVSLTLVTSTVPPGSTSSFSPAALVTGSSSLQLVLPDSAQPGRWLVKVAGRSGSIVDTIAGLLIIQAAPVPPDFIFNGFPASVTVTPGSSAQYVLELKRNLAAIGLGNFTQSVTGLPKGATSSFTPVNSFNNSQLTVTTSSTTPDGVYPLTLIGTLDTLVRTYVVTLVVETPANFTMSLTPPALTVARNASNSVDVSI